MAKEPNIIPPDRRKALFLEAYARIGIIGPACVAAGIGRSTHSLWKTEDKEFAAAASDALETAIDAAEAELRRRAVEGIEEPILTRDGMPIWRRDPDTGDVLLDDDFQPVPFVRIRSSDKLLEVYMQAKRREYRNKSGGLEIGLPGGPDGVPSTITVRFIDSDGDGRPADADNDPLS